MRTEINIMKLHKVVIFTLIFLMLTIVGTLSHEITHYSVSKLIGLNPNLHFGSVSFSDKINLLERESHNYMKFLKSTIAGPLQTLLTGSIGFLLLVARRHKNKYTFRKKDWFALFMALFWLRQCFNLGTTILISVYNKELTVKGDEAFIASHFNLNPISLDLILGTIGFVICYITIFKILPIRYRLSLILGGVLGSIIGYILWFHIFGKIVLP